MRDYTKLPERFREGVRRYIELGIRPGSFLSAVIQNDLIGATGRADLQSERELRAIVQWFYNEAPCDCWRTANRYADWIAIGGLKGLKEGRT